MWGKELKGQREHDGMAKEFNMLQAGVLLFGVASFIVSLVIVHFYFSMISGFNSGQPDFSASCERSVVQISAYKQLGEVKVADAGGNVVCSFQSISAGSDEICYTKATGMLTVVSGNLKKVVNCMLY